EKAKISKVNPNAKSGKKSIRNLVGKISVGSKQKPPINLDISKIIGGNNCRILFYKLNILS
ncbi:MAG: hypothetical protein E6Y45_04570, partial [Finegoldia magna]|nr:hypothetical protein [Finegoldia magna]